MVARGLLVPGPGSNRIRESSFHSSSFVTGLNPSPSRDLAQLAGERRLMPGNWVSEAKHRLGPEGPSPGATQVREIQPFPGAGPWPLRSLLSLPALSEQLARSGLANE